MGKSKAKLTAAQLKKRRDAKLQKDCCAFMADLSAKIYESEESRARSIIDQAGRMQAAFSFVLAAVLVSAQIIVPLKTLSRGFLLLSYFSVLLFLMMCLIFATIAQQRAKRAQWPSISDIKNQIINEYQSFATSAQRNKYLAETYEDMFRSYERINDKRVLWIRLSMLMFYIALGCIAFWSLTGLLHIIGLF